MAEPDPTGTNPIIAADCGLLFERPPQPSLRSLFIQADIVETEVDNTPSLSCQSTNTARRSTRSAGMVHVEGGWPASVDAAEIDERIKHAKRAQREDSYLRDVAGLLSRLSAPLRVNAAIDIYGTFFDNPPGVVSPVPVPVNAADLPQQQPPAAPPKTASHYRDSATIARRLYTAEDAAQLVVTCRIPAPPSNEACPRPATSMAWMFSEPGRLAVCYGAGASRAVGSLLGDDARELAAALWDTAKGGSTPVTWFYSDTVISAMAANVKDAHIVVSGTESGAVQLYDSRGGSLRSTNSSSGGGGEVTTDVPSLRASIVSPQAAGHSGRIVAVRCLISKSIEFFSVGADGRVLFWDARNLSSPCDTVALALPSSEATRGTLDASLHRNHAATCVDFDPVGSAAAKIVLGTAEGAVALVMRSAGTRAGSDRITGRFEAHYGPVVDVSRHPHAAKVFASVGDWVVKCYTEESRTPIMQSGFYHCRLVAGKWHPLRPAVFLTAAADGTLAVWDLLRGLSGPVMSQTVVPPNAAPTSLTVRADGQIAAVSDSVGGVSLVQLPAVVACPTDRNEKSDVAHMIDLETARERQAAAAADAKARLAAALKQPLAGGGKLSRDDNDNASVDDTVRQAETEFLARVRGKSEARAL